MFHLLGQIGQPENEIQMIVQTLLRFAFIISLFSAQGIQDIAMLRQIEVTLRKIKGLRDDGKEASIKTIKEIGKPEKDPTPMVERFMEHFLIEPVGMDPAGIVQKLGKILDVREVPFEKEGGGMAPSATPSERNNIENLL